MLQSYEKIYELASELGALRARSSLFGSEKFMDREVMSADLTGLRDLLTVMPDVCAEFGLIHTAELAKRTSTRPNPRTNSELHTVLTNLHDSLSFEIEREAVFRIPADRKDFYGQDHLLGKKVATAFPSCAHDIQKAGDCYALGLEDACVHHLMLVLERGLNALAKRVGVPFQNTNWQMIINNVRGELNKLTKGPERDFLENVNSEFGFLKVAYRNHSEHAHDDPYDLEKALSILNHVRDFMKALEKGGLSEVD